MQIESNIMSFSAYVTESLRSRLERRTPELPLEQCLSSPSAYCYLLVLCAHLQPEVQIKLQNYAPTAVDIFRLEPMAEHPSPVLPVLFDVSQPQAQDCEMWAEVLDAHAQANCCIYFASHLPYQKMLQALQARTNVMLPDKWEMLLLYFDTRCLGELLRVLQPQQQDAFTGCAQLWAWADRQSHTQVVCVSKEAQATSFAAPLHLNEAQQAHMIDAREPDTLLALTRQNTVRKTSLPPFEQYQCACSALQAAKQAKITDPRDQSILCDSALQYGPGIFAHDPWKSALKAITDGVFNLQECVGLMLGEKDWRVNKQQ